MKKLATLLGLAGAVLLALNLDLTLVAYVIMLVSSSIIVWKLWRTEKEVVFLNAGFALINVLGIVRAF